MMTGLVSMDTAELEALLKEWGEPRFRAKQVFSWLSRGVKPENMTNLPKTLRNRLSELAFDGAEIYDKFISQKDGTIKYLFSLSDGNIVEGVLMRYHYGNTLCISTQVGCRMGCKFCASTLNGLIRNLTPGEILSQILLVNALHKNDPTIRLRRFTPIAEQAYKNIFPLLFSNFISTLLLYLLYIGNYFAASKSAKIFLSSSSPFEIGLPK